jgi:dTDP-4-amino-4,6-dideoxy-D-galactose acyltransferase
MKPPSWNPLAFLEKLFPDTYLSAREPECSGKVTLLEWDSQFFGSPMYRIESLPSKEPNFLTSWIQSQTGPFYVSAEVPAEDSHALTELSTSGFRLVETRLTYYHLLKNLPPQEKPTRKAGIEDIPFLKKTASGAVNDYDKYHTDPFFSPEEASRYLETYIANCVQGFSEEVCVPDHPNQAPPLAFAALSRIQPEGFSEPFFRIPLTACLPENKGWHYHLCLKALHQASQKGGLALVMTTQATNKAVIHNCEKLGFKFGSCTHIFSTFRR